MSEAIRQLRSEARQLAHWKVPTAIRYPAPFRARPPRSRGRSSIQGR